MEIPCLTPESPPPPPRAAAHIKLRIYANERTDGHGISKGAGQKRVLRSAAAILFIRNYLFLEHFGKFMSTVAAVFLHVLIVIMLINKSNWSQLFLQFYESLLNTKTWSRLSG
jgi:hypothetical protein